LLDVGLLENPLRLLTEWFEDRDGFPALAWQQIWGVGAVEHVVSWMVDAGAEIDGAGTFGNVVLAFCELNHHRGSEEQEGLGGVLVEDGLCLQ